MKRIVLIAISVVLAASIFVLCGCEVNVDTTGTTATTAAPSDIQEPTAIVAVTDEKGVVIATEAVTMSAEDKAQEKDFFTPSKSQGLSSGVSSDRVQQALQNAGVSTTTATSSASGSSTATTSASSKPYVQDDYLVLRSSQYMINFRVVDAEGVVHSFKLAKNGTKTSITTIYNNIPMTMIMGDTNWYLLTSEDKSYIEFPKSLVESQLSADEEFGQYFLGDPFKFGGTKLSETTVTEDGIAYRVLEFDNGNKDYYIGKTLIKTLSPDSSVTYYDNISAVAPMSLFTPPADYTKLVINEENASDIVGSLDPSAAESTTHNHADHE